MIGTPGTAPTDAMPALGPEPVLDPAQSTGNMVVVHLVVATEDLVHIAEKMAVTEERISVIPDPRKRSPINPPRMMNRQSRTAGTTQILF